MSSKSSPQASAKSNRPQVIIAGAGIGGLTLAIRLAISGFRPIVLEARDEASIATEGAFLTLAPNGMNGLKTIGCDDAVRRAGIDTRGIAIVNGHGRLLGFAGQDDHESTYGAPSVTLGRGTLAALLIRRARAAGIELRFNARVASLEDGGDVVSLGLAESGERVEGDMLVAADGLRSKVRELRFPEYPKPHYTGLIGTGGITDCPVPPTDGILRMTFGDNAFFGFIKEGDGPVYWFNSYAADEQDTRPVANPAAYARKITALHAKDPSENRAILHSVPAIERNYPVYDVPELAAWQRGRTVLLGDAAHAVGPHAGQGASMAIEDAVVLSACLEAEAEPEAAFGRYEELRRSRVGKVVRLTRQNASQKKSSGALGLFIRDLILPFLIPIGMRAGRRLLAHRVDLDPLALPAS
jgi:2-polyprenyl-6-methoxyphenol hydroxylase-like FAD-dependent oxidoreductase